MSINTKYLKNNTQDIITASEILKSGGIVAIPTETVYGLAADMYNTQAVDKIFQAKNRPNDNPLIVHICDINQVYNLTDDFCVQAQELVKKYWPGPLTIILNKKKSVPNNITGNLDSVAIRFPAHKTAQKIIKHTGVPLVAPSANSSGKPSPTSFEHVLHDLDHKIDAILDGGTCDIGLESTVISFLEKTPRLLRPGFITQENIQSIIPEIIIDNSVYSKLDNNQKVISPGTKYKHYAPKSPVILINSSTENYVNFINQKYNQDQNILAMCFDEDLKHIKNNIKYISYGPENNFETQSRNLFKILRDTENIDISEIYVHINNNINNNFCDLKTAVYNRLVRAAGFNIINLI